MQDIRILFLAPNWRVSLLRSFKKSISGKFFLVGADSDPYSAGLNVVDQKYVIPKFTEQGCFERIRVICDKENIDTILPMTNKAIIFMDKNREWFNKKDLALYLADHSAIKICNDKRILAGFFTENNIASPDLINVKEPYPGFPLIAKEPCGEGGKNCFKIENQADLNFYSKKLPSHIFQKFIKGREFSVDWFSDKQGVPIVIVPRERLATRGGEVMTSRIEMISDIIEFSKKLGTLLKLRGPANFQCILDESGSFFFTDVNLRFGSGALHTIHAGADIPRMIFQELVGQPVDKIDDHIMDGSKMFRFHDAIFDS
ncbi:MAG: ATP-grasp domain-containing protein [Nitrospina sp.]|jgi:carbamoyl-phosphate synthase large subunit|nr:ATP-grasp domain-containing protein [Nitrospina sp.]